MGAILLLKCQQVMYTITIIMSYVMGRQSYRRTKVAGLAKAYVDSWGISEYVMGWGKNENHRSITIK